PEGFDARFSATARLYHYGIADRECEPNPKQARYVLTHPKVLEVDKMSQAAAEMVGLKDFGAFCKPRAGATTIRELRRLEVEREESGRIVITFEADAFCHNMVRSLVGALIAVGEGRIRVAELVAIQQAAVRTSKFKVVDPRGLSLDGVDYPAEHLLAAQAEKARNMRSSEEISV
ncbi:MAG: tRNA pseudouridine(38-40) synthase TruA, partial [Aquiluna sp.]